MTVSYSSFCSLTFRIYFLLFPVKPSTCRGGEQTNKSLDTKKGSGLLVTLECFLCGFGKEPTDWSDYSNKLYH